MPQHGFFDLAERSVKLDGNGDPLGKIMAAFDWDRYSALQNREMKLGVQYIQGLRWLKANQALMVGYGSV